MRYNYAVTKDQDQTRHILGVHYSISPCGERSISSLSKAEFPSYSRVVAVSG